MGTFRLRWISMIFPLCAFAQFASASEGMDRAKDLVAQMRHISMVQSAHPKSDGSIDPAEDNRQRILDQVTKIGKESVDALSTALSDSEVQVRRNAALVLIYLGGGYSETAKKIDTKSAAPELIKALKDEDASVRAHAADALSEIGPAAKDAVPALIGLLSDKEEGPRNQGCFALGKMGRAAKEALSELRKRLDDDSADVADFARKAINAIENDLEKAK